MARPKVVTVPLSAFDIPGWEFDPDERVTLTPFSALPVRTALFETERNAKDGARSSTAQMEWCVEHQLVEIVLKQPDGTLFPSPKDDPDVWRSWPVGIMLAIVGYAGTLFTGREPVRAGIPGVDEPSADGDGADGALGKAPAAD